MSKVNILFYVIVWEEYVFIVALVTNVKLWKQILNFLNAIFVLLPLVIIISRCNKLYISLSFQFLLQLFNDLFKNNANRAETTERKQNQNYFMEVMTVDGVYDYLMYVGKV